MSLPSSRNSVVIEVVQHLRPGGLETLVLDLQKLLAPQHRVLVVSLEGRHEESVAAWPALAERARDLVFLDKRPGWQPGTVRALWRLFRAVRPAAVHSHHIGPLLYAGIAARLAGVARVVHTEHDAWHLEEARRLLLQRLALRVVKPTLVADSEMVALKLRSLLPGCNPRIIRNGVDTRRFRPGSQAAARARLGLPQACRLIGCAARLHPVKNHAALLRAVATLPPGVHLALAGVGELERELREHANKLGIAERVHFLGLVSDMPAFYQAIDLFCLPSRAEGMPLSPLEAQACGRPVVATNVGGTAETICPLTGVLVEAGDDGALADALGRAIERPPGSGSRLFVNRFGSAATMIDSYQKILAAEVA